MSRRIEKWYYINLAHRTDRDTHIRKELGVAGILDSDIERVDAIYHERGAYGCAQSHAKAMKLGLDAGWRTFAIVEDDFTIRDHGSFLSQIEAAPKFDIFLGALGNINLHTVPYGPTYCRVLRAQTASCYAVTREYAPTLCANFAESVNLLSDEFEHKSNNWLALDDHWKRLQPHALWISIRPALGYQREDYSDIEKKDVSYNC
jgi:hypothetical protein